MADKESGSVLVIDDDDMARLFICKVIRIGFPEFVIRDTAGGSDSIELARLYKPDIVLTDLMMPPPDGFKVCRFLKGDVETKDISIVIITALDNEDSRTVAIRLGAEEYIVKPFRVDELKKCIEMVMRGRRLGLYSE